MAAPLLILNAKKLDGQVLLRPHLVFGVSVVGREVKRDQPGWVAAAWEGAAGGREGFQCRPALTL